ncbi:MAG: ATP-NAD kinase family protein [Thermoplasmatales archaeon]|nr:ATP-NAD kinase family protein [Thermoplasmatales archaeon]
MKKIGFLINPVAGMGGKVGLKGTDGKVEEALKMGARPVSFERAKKAMECLKNYKNKMKIFTCSGEMGEKCLKGFEHEIVYSPPEKTTADDTKKACRKFLEKEVDLVLFCGGDGTARDVYDVVGHEIPMIGIPSGVKMHSAVFGLNPRIVGEIVVEFLENEMEFMDAEVMDTDEEKYRRNILDVKLFGYARIPYKPMLVQAGKSIFQSPDEKTAKKDIARYVVEMMEKDVLYVLGAGTTVKEIADLLNAEKTLLGVDVMKNKRIVAKDVNEKQLLDIIKDEKKAKIVVSPIGAQGFVFGRGNQQMSPDVIKKVGTENIIIVAAKQKILSTPNLLVDTGDETLDKKLKGYRKVVTGYHEMTMKKIGE